MGATLYNATNAVGLATTATNTVSVPLPSANGVMVLLIVGYDKDSATAATITSPTIDGGAATLVDPTIGQETTHPTCGRYAGYRYLGTRAGGNINVSWSLNVANNNHYSIIVLYNCVNQAPTGVRASTASTSRSTVSLVTTNSPTVNDLVIMASTVPVQISTASYGTGQTAYCQGFYPAATIEGTLIVSGEVGTGAAMTQVHTWAPAALDTSITFVIAGAAQLTPISVAASATITPAISLSADFNRALSASLTATSALSNKKIAPRALAGALSLAPVISTKRIFSRLSAAGITLAPTITRKLTIPRLSALGITLTPALASKKFRVMTAALSFSLGFARRTYNFISFSGNLVASGALAKQFLLKRSLAGSATLAPGFSGARIRFVALAGTATLSAALASIRGKARSLQASLNFQLAFSEDHKKLYLVSLDRVFSLQLSFSEAHRTLSLVSLSRAFSLAPSVIRSITRNRIMQASVTITGAQSKRFIITRALAGTITFARGQNYKITRRWDHDFQVRPTILSAPTRKRTLALSFSALAAMQRVSSRSLVFARNFTLTAATTKLLRRNVSYTLPLLPTLVPRKHWSRTMPRVITLSPSMFRSIGRRDILLAASINFTIRLGNRLLEIGGRWLRSVIVGIPMIRSAMTDEPETVVLKTKLDKVTLNSVDTDEGEIQKVEAGDEDIFVSVSESE